MSYVFWNILWCLLGAALLGGVIGWLLRHWRAATGAAETGQWWQDRIGGLESERDQLAAAAREAGEKLSLLQASGAGLESERAAWEAGKAKWEAEASAALAAAEDWKRKATECGVVIGDLENRLQISIAEDRADDAAYEKVIAELKARLSALEGERDRISAERTALQDQLQQATRRLKADDEAYRKELAGLTAQLAWAQQPLAKAAELRPADSGEQQAELAELRRQIPALQAQVAEAVAERQGLDAERESFRTQLTAIAADRDSFLAQITDFTGRSNEQISRLEAELTAAAAERSTLQAQLGELSTLKPALAGMRAEYADLASREAAQKARVADLQSRIERLINDDKSNDASYEKEISAMKAALAQANAEVARVAADSHAEREVHLAQLSALEAEAATAGALAKKVTELEAQSKKAQPGDIERIEGIGVAYGQRLRAAGIAWVRDLLARGSSSEGRQQIVAQTGIKAELILTWVNAADLLRVDGVTPDWAELLEAAGVDTVKELRNRVPANLLEKMTETNPFGPGGRFSPTLPELEEVESWVGQAKAMAPRVTH